MTGVGGILLLTTVLVGILVFYKRKNKSSEEKGKENVSYAEEMTDVTALNSFGELTIPYNELTLDKKIGEGVLPFFISH